MKKQRAIMTNQTEICNRALYYALYLYQLGYSVFEIMEALVEELPDGWDHYIGVLPHMAPLFLVLAAEQAGPNTAPSPNATQPAESLIPSLF